MLIVNSFKLFNIWVTLMPLVMWGGFYEGPKVLYFLTGSFLICVFWLINIAKSGGFLKLGRKDLLYFFWIGIISLASLLGIHPLESFLGGSYRHQGVIFFLGLWLV